ncbi:MAG TPA: helix-turn-helix transcriptional regulator [Actinomycetota bacterium]|nr:helix-turn-helix transcriptional regulator [Actinomycetota bacterium]
MAREGPGERTRRDRPDERAVYIISVAAEIAGVHPQTLRMYERRGLLSPKRTTGNTRRYSERDIERIRLIQQLTQRQGISLAGVGLFIAMRERLEEMELRAAELERELRRRVASSSAGAEIVPLRSVLAFRWDEGRWRGTARQDRGVP